MSERWIIAAAEPGEWRSAFELALAHLPQGDRAARVLNALTLLAAGEVDPAGVWVARTADGLAGVQACVPLPGAAGLVWLPGVAPEQAGTDLAERLTAAGLGWLRRRGAKFAQALADSDGRAAVAPLLRAGFRRVTQLVYLRHDLSDVLRPSPSPRFRLEPVSAANQAAFEDTLLGSYEGTLDCPELNGRRTIAEILEGHRAQGKWRPDHWRLAFDRETPAGILLLADLEDTAGWDLSYLGVTPSFRRIGLGRWLSLVALEAARDAGAPQLTVAVDQRNLPALRLYESVGFERVQVKEVYLYFYDQAVSEPRP